MYFELTAPVRLRTDWIYEEIKWITKMALRTALNLLVK